MGISYISSDEYHDSTTTRMSRETMDYLAREVESAKREITERSGSLLKSITDTYERYSGERARRRRSINDRNRASLWDGGVIRLLSDIDGLQSATGVMQSFVMAHPELRRRYYDLTIDGYSDSYEDMGNGDIGEEHITYRDIYNGNVTVTDKGYEYTCYTDSEDNEDRELDAVQQDSIISTHELIDIVLEHGGEDPTSRYGGLL